MRVISFLLLGCGLAWGLSGCGGSAPEGGTPEGGAGTKVIGAALLTKTHVFYQDMVEAMKAEAAKNNITIRFQFAEFDGQKQNNHIETFIQQKVDALIIAPHDSGGVAPVIAEARAAGIPVFTADIAATGADVVSHIASDNEAGGRLLGEYLAKLLGGKGKIAIIDHPIVSSVQDRTRGFEAALAAFPEMQIVQRVPGDGQLDKAFTATQRLLEAQKDITAIFGINDDSALGALAAVESAGLSDSIVIVGFDGTPEARKKIAEGSILKADTVQFPDKIGTATIQTIVRYWNGETVPPSIPVEVAVIDQESLKNEAAP
ncbi:MAG: substrate-binding domain-containing protein [Candidatus Hydrogenedentes bacterium]|nr:substrate-binding domain-containing protein [Candidatus Hydrogenedentota bacterium]